MDIKKHLHEQIEADTRSKAAAQSVYEHDTVAFLNGALEANNATLDVILSAERIAADLASVAPWETGNTSEDAFIRIVARELEAGEPVKQVTIAEYVERAFSLDGRSEGEATEGSIFLLSDSGLAPAPEEFNEALVETDAKK